MSDRDGSGMTRQQQPTLEDLVFFLKTFYNGRRNDSGTHDDDLISQLYPHRPVVSRAVSDVVRSSPHLIPQIFQSAATPAKRSEAEGTLRTSDRL